MAEMNMKIDCCWGDNQMNADNLVPWVETRSDKGTPSGRRMKHD